MADRSVVVKLGANVTGFVNGIRVAERSAVDFGKNAVNYGQKYGAELDSIAMKAGILGTGLVALAGFAVKSAIDWETAWAGVTKTVDGTPAQLAAIEQGLKDMSTQLPATAIELAGIAESAGALGVHTEDILSFTRVMADLGQTTNLTSDEAATSIAQLMNVMQTAPDDVDNLGAALVDLGNKGASTERQIIQMAQNIAGAGSIVGLTEANVLGLANALASSGIDAEAGGSAISNVLIDISKAVDTNSDKLGKFAKVAGTTAEDFAAKWKSTPAEALTEFVEGLGRMNESGQDVFSTLTALGQSDIRVTRALLNMAASGDLLRESLSNGDTAWERNTALAAEAAKRYDTTAAQTKMAWNEIKNAAVDAGNALLPVVASIAGTVGDIASAFGSLPGPVKGALTSIAGVGGVGLLAAAGVLKLVTSVAAAKTAFSALELASPGLASKLGMLTKGFVAVTAAATAAQILSNMDKMDVAGVNKFTRALLEAADGSDKLLNNLSSVGSSGPLGWNRNEIDGVADALKNAADAKGALDLSFGHESKLERGTEFIEQMDAALTSLVASGAIDEAATAFDYLSTQAEEVGIKSSELKDLFPQYTDALAGVDVQSNLAAKSTTALGSAIDVIPGMTEEATKALNEARDAARKTGEAFFDISEGVDDADVSLAKWIKNMADQAKALNDFATNAKRAGKRGLEDGLIADLEELGPAGAMRMAQLANATDAEIKRANAAWRRGQRAIDNYVDSVASVPKSVSTKVTADTRAAQSAIVSLYKFANSLPFITVTVPTPKRTSGQTKASGGPIFGPGSGTSDDVPIMASNGEHVMTAREVDAAGGHTAVMAWRRALLAGNDREYAGSPSTHTTMGGDGSSLELGAGSTRAIAAAVEQAVTAGMHGATFQTMPDGTVRLIMKGGR